MLSHNYSRLRERIIEIGTIGRTAGGGVSRPAFSPGYFAAAERFAARLAAAGLAVRRDGVGNVIGTKAGSRTDRAIMIGSHLDTVPDGGIFDGALGAAVALEFASFLQDSRTELNHTLHVVGFSAEEGSALGGTFGSRAMLGLIDPGKAGLAEKLQSVGLTAEDLRNSRIDPAKLACFLEMHIEQGDILDISRTPVGIVSGIVGITRYRITVTGESNHAGTTAMAGRRDAFQAFAALAVRANAMFAELDETLAGTFGVVEVYPNVINIIPGRVEAVLELRHMEQAVIDRAVAGIKEIAVTIPTAGFQFTEIIRKPSCRCSEAIIAVMEETCREISVPYRVMPSGAGHDANAVARVAPVGMLFVPSVGGKSHCPDERTEWEDIQRGYDIFCRTILKLDRAPFAGK